MNPQGARSSGAAWNPWEWWQEAGRRASEAAYGDMGAQLLSPLVGLVDAARDRLVGRRVTWRVGDRVIAGDVEDVSIDTSRALLGQIDDVVVTAARVDWGRWRFTTVRMELHNVHVRWGTLPRVVSAPIDVLCTIDTTWLDALVRARVPGVGVVIGPDAAVFAVARRWRIRLALDLEADASRILVRPAPVDDLPFAPAWRRVRLTIRPKLPPDARLVSVRAVAGGLQFHVRVDAREVDYEVAQSYLSRFL